MDKLLNAVKDFETIKRYLEAINQTTDDYLFVLDIPNDQIQIFGNISEYFDINNSGNNVLSTRDILGIIHPSDRRALISEVNEIRTGIKDIHDINFRMYNRRGETLWVNSRGKVLHNEDGAPIAMIGRISEEALRHLFNPSTGLWNIVKLRADLKVRLREGKGWLLTLGIPMLADIRLSHGKNFGNQLLGSMVEILEKLECFDEIYHIDYNNFAAILPDCDSDRVESVYQQICREMNEICSVCASAVPIDNSIFIDSAQLIDSANISLREASQNPTGNVRFFSTDEIEKLIGDFKLLEEFKQSVQNNFEGFELYYQPQVKNGSCELYGVEALLRYSSPTRGRVFPDEFIPILEQSGLIDPVGMWVLETALAQCREWRECIPSLQVSVNFSSVQFEDRSLGEKIVDALRKARLPGNALTVELTESVQLGENKNYLSIIKYIKSHGVRFAIDDFGTGYSNLGYLKQLDVNEIKIDRSFVSEIEKNTYNYRLVSNVIEFAKTNSIHTCCEGIETAKELSVLESLQADIFQGYLFDKPCTADEITEKYINRFSDGYKSRIKAVEEINRFKEKYGIVHFEPKNILRANNIGLWIIRIDAKNGVYELYVDDVMEKMLCITDSLSPAECYEYWYGLISKEDREYVDNTVDIMIKEGRAVQLQYHWNHPKLGELIVRSSGIRTPDEGGRIVLEGYHRIVD